MAGPLGFGVYSYDQAFVDIVVRSGTTMCLLFESALGLAGSIKQRAPWMTIVGRKYWHETVQDAIMAADDGPQRMYNEAISLCDNHPAIDVWQGLNEASRAADTYWLSRQVAVELGFADALATKGKGMVIINHATGNFPTNDPNDGQYAFWDEYIRIVRPLMTHRAARYLGLHLYSGCGPCLMQQDSFWNALRHESYLQGIEARGLTPLPVFVSEWSHAIGWKGYFTTDQVKADFRWWGEQVRGKIAGSAVFCLGDSGGWDHFNIQGTSIVDDMIAFNGGGTGDPPPPTHDRAWAFQQFRNFACSQGSSLCNATEQEIESYLCDTPNGCGLFTAGSPDAEVRQLICGTLTCPRGTPPPAHDRAWAFQQFRNFACSQGSSFCNATEQEIEAYLCDSGDGCGLFVAGSSGEEVRQLICGTLTCPRTPPEPTLRLSASTSTVRRNQTITFQLVPENVGTITGITWYLGDGRVLTRGPELSIATSYPDAGTFGASARVTNAAGTQYTSGTLSITVRPMPTVSISADVPQPVVGQPVRFAITAHDFEPEYGVVAYGDWDFGDGNSIRVTGGVALASYKTHGAYSVKARVTTSQGNLQIDSNVIAINVPAPMVSLSGAPSRVVLGGSVQLSGTVSNFGSVIVVEWLVDDEFVGTSTSLVHSLVMSVPGPHTISARITNEYGAQLLTNPVVITVDVGVSPAITLAATPRPAGSATSFVAAWGNMGQVTIVSIEFGDGRRYSGPPAPSGDRVLVSHIYAEAGTYTAFAMAENSVGEAIRSQDVMVVVPARAEVKGLLTVSHNRVNAGDAVNVRVTLDNVTALQGILYDLGGGQHVFTNKQDITFRYNVPGEYTVGSRIFPTTQPSFDTNQQTVQVSQQGETQDRPTWLVLGGLGALVTALFVATR
ncbi:MAG: PKD domain-containing protein [Dehalococcoidia bacterium]|nr:MAG: PKD domain-containing protein [Dehalococcoidia bacterium]